MRICHECRYEKTDSIGAQCILTRKADITAFLQLPFSFLFGAVINLYDAVIRITPVSITGKLLILAAAILLTALGTYLMTMGNLILNPPDGMVRTLSEFTGKPLGPTRNIFDISMVVLSAAAGLILMAVTVLNMVLAPLCTCPLLIAAEKEQGTLPLLRRSKVRGGEFIAAKSAAAVLTGIIAAVIIYLIAGEDRALLGEYLLLNAVIMISLLPYGLFIAVFARDQNSLNVYPIPGVLVFYVLPVFSMFHPLFGELARWVPTGLYSVIFRQTAPAEYNTFLDIPFFWSAIVCVVWFVGGIVLLWLAVKKRDYLVSLESYK